MPQYGDVEIREFRREDGEQLRAFWIACGIKIRPGDDDASLERTARHSPGLFLIGEENGDIVACALAAWDGRRAWLYHVAAHPAMRRRGLAAEIVRELETRLREIGCPKVNLIVWNDNDPAMRFWEALGYRREATVEYAKELG